jgi:DNA polymerase
MGESNSYRLEMRAGPERRLASHRVSFPEREQKPIPNPVASASDSGERRSQAVMEETRKRVRDISAQVRAHLEEELDLGERAIAVARPTASKRTASGRPPGPEAGGRGRERRSAGKSRPEEGASGGAAPEEPRPRERERSSSETRLTRTAAVAPDERRARLEELAREAACCQSCELHRNRTRSVFHRGDADSRLVFVGEGPGYEEDQQGEAFVGQAGQLLDRMIAAMGFERDQVYICNVVKCRPPENRTPLPEEAEACRRFLQAQLELVSPDVIVALGRCAAQNLGVAPPTGRWRGAWGQWHGIPVMPTYHPAYLLRTPSAKRPVWDDLQQVMKKLGLSPP